REHGPALSLSTLDHFVEYRYGHRDNDKACDEAREERVAHPELVADDVPDDRPGKDEHTEAADDPRRAHVRPKRVGAARTESISMLHNAITVLPLAGRACVALRAAGTSSKEMRVIGGVTMRPSTTACASRSSISLDIGNAKLMPVTPLARRAASSAT